MKQQAKPARRTSKGASTALKGTRSPSANVTRESNHFSSIADISASQWIDAFRLLFDNHPVPTWVCDPKTLAFLAVNEAVQEKYGYSRDEFLEMTLKDILPAEDVLRLLGDKKRKRPLSQYSGLWHHRLKNGMTIEAEITSCIIEYEGDQALLIVAKNVTERKRAAEALRLSEEKYRALVENTNDVHFALDPQGCLTYISPAIERFASYQASEIVGQPFARFVHPEDLPILGTSFEQTLIGNMEPFEFRVFAKDGSVLHVRTSSRPLWEGDRLAGLTGIMVDVTESKRTEAALRESDARLRALIDNLPVEFWAMDSNLCFSMQNAASSRTIGNVVGRKVEDLDVPAKVRATWQELDRQVLGGNTLHGQYEIEVEDEQRAYENFVAPVKVGNKITGLVGVAMDITARKRAEDALQKAHIELERRVEERTADLARANRMLNILSECNQTVVRAVEESVLLDQICQIIVNLGGYPLVWVGYAEQDAAQSVRPVAQAGFEDGYLNTLNITWADTDRGRGPTGTATRWGQPCIARDIQTDPSYAPWREDAIQRGYASSIALPLNGDDCVLGALNIYSTMPDAFHAEEVNMLMELAGDLAFGITSLRERIARKWAEEALRESEQRYRSLVDLSPDAVAVHNGEKLLFVNLAGAKMVGVENPQDAVGMAVVDFVHPDSRPMVAARVREMFQEWKVAPLIEEKFQRVDGSVFYVEIAAMPVMWQGTPAIQVAFRDITERKRAEEALQESEQRYRSLFDRVPVALYRATPDGELLDSNPAHARIFGYADRVSWFDNNTIEHYVNPEDRNHWRAIAERDGTVRGYEMQMRRNDGTLICVRNSCQVVSDNQGKVLYYEGSLEDITERKQAEDALRRRLAELEAISRISVALRTAQTRDDALPILLDETLTALEADAGVIWLYYPEYDELRAAADRGWFRQLSKTPMKPSDGIAGKVFASGQSHVSAEFARDPIAHATTRPQIPSGWGGACVPIRVGMFTVGVLFVSLPLPRQLAAEQVSLLESLAEMGGAALHRMSLHEETARRLDQLQALHLIDRAITASMDLRMTLDILLEQVITQLKVDATDVLLLNPNTLTLEYTAGRGFHTPAVESVHIRLGESFAGRVALEHRAIHLNDPTQIQENPQFAAFWAGEGLVAYYAVPLIAKGQVKAVLEIFHRAPLAAERDWVSFLETLAGQAAIAIENAQLFNHLQRSNADLALAYDATIEGWSKALDLRDRETEGHALRVTKMTLRLARVAQMTDEELVHVRRGALLHDIGKMGVPDAILFKPASLTEEEWIIMRKHPIYAYEMLSSITYLRSALDIPYCHHEKWDGTGYPRGLKGQQIPLAARLFAVIDMYDALTSHRLYRAAWSREKTLEHIESLSGIHFDPQVVGLFLKEMKEKGDAR